MSEVNISRVEQDETPLTQEEEELSAKLSTIIAWEVNQRLATVLRHFQTCKTCVLCAEMQSVMDRLYPKEENPGA